MIIHTFQGLFFIYLFKKKRFDEKKIRIHIQHTKIHTHNDVKQVFSMKNTMFEFEKMLRSIYLVLWTELNVTLYTVFISNKNLFPKSITLSTKMWKPY